MTMVNIPFSPLGETQSFHGNNDHVEILLDAADEKTAHCAFWTTPDGATRSITHICYGITVPTTANLTLRAQLESIDDATGYESGIIAAGATGSQTITGAGASEYRWVEQALTTPYTLSSGIYLAAVVEVTARTAGSVSSATHAGNTTQGTNWINETLGGTQSRVNGRTNIALKCSDGTYLIPFDGGAFTATRAQAISTSTNPRYVGNKIICAKTSRLMGVSTPYFGPTQNIKIALVDVNGNILKADNTTTDMVISLDKDYLGFASRVLGRCYFPAPRTLTADTAYYLIFSPDTSTSSNIRYILYNSTDLLAQAHRIPSGWTCHAITSPSAWSITELTTTMYNTLPVFDQIDIPAGGSGGAINLDKMGAM